MERRLMQALEANPADGTEASWTYLTTHAGNLYRQQIVHCPSEGGYRSRIYCFVFDAGRSVDGKPLWEVSDGLFETTDEALEFGVEVILDHQAE